MNKSRWIILLAAVFTLIAPADRLTAADADPQVIEIHAKKYEFVPAEITLKKGVPVKLKLASDDVLHSIVISGLHINELMKVGEVSEIAVTPTETGDFKGVCGKFCGAGHGKMLFTVHVVAP